MTRPTQDSLEAIAALQRVAELFSERRQQLARDSGITEAQWRVLEEVAGESFMPSMFAKRRSCTAAAVSRTLRQLLDGDLVRASIDASDGRQRVYRLTARGRRTLDRLETNRREAIEAVWAPLPAGDLRTFARLAGDLADRLEDYAQRK